MKDLKKIIRNVNDFPKKGVGFKDITPLLNDPAAFKVAVDAMLEFAKPLKPTKVAAIESRGFFFGSVLAYELNAGFVPLRKEGKLPHVVIREDYATEYSNAVLEIHQDAIKPGDKVLICDDVLATGGTAEAAISLVNKLGGKVVGFAALIELEFLNPKEKIKDIPVFSVLKYGKGDE